MLFLPSLRVTDDSALPSSNADTRRERLPKGFFRTQKLFSGHSLFFVR